MGLTVHYKLKTSVKTPAKAMGLIEKMRQIAMDIPFEKVGEIRHIGPEICQIPIEDLRGKPECDLVLDGMQSITLPWTKKKYGSRSSSCSTELQPLEIYSFNIIPGPGSEWISLGFCRYPEEIDVVYRPQQDSKFNTYQNDRFNFDWGKWDKWLRKNNCDGWETPSSCEKPMKLKTRLGGWRWSSFCKTQYASEYGIPNFVRCHVGLIYLLDQIAKLPTVKVEVDDEGQYGRSYYTDEPSAKDRVYTWHEGKYSVPDLIKEIGEWNEMIASMFGGLKDQGFDIQSPIRNYSNFEHLEFKGMKQEGMQKFLQEMQQLARKEVA